MTGKLDPHSARTLHGYESTETERHLEVVLQLTRIEVDLLPRARRADLYLYLAVSGWLALAGAIALCVIAHAW